MVSFLAIKSYSISTTASRAAPPRTATTSALAPHENGGSVGYGAPLPRSLPGPGPVLEIMSSLH